MNQRDGAPGERTAPRRSNRRSDESEGQTSRGRNWALTLQFDETNPFSSTTIQRADRSPKSALICAAQFNRRRAHRPAVLAGSRYGNGARDLAVFDDPRRRGQTGFGRLGAKGWPHTG
jgi:hypothetical protein